VAYGAKLYFCSDCEQDKPAKDFTPSPRNTGRGGLDSFCKTCRNIRNTKRRSDPEIRKKLSELAVRRYRLKKSNFTPEMFLERLIEQGNVCAICGIDKAGGRGDFHADHDHKTSKPRGVLCHKCNVGLGHFNDDIEIMQIAIEYIKKYTEDK
jgi:hypothetical protein